jgi:trehalose 2-sulfotransferase
MHGASTSAARPRARYPRLSYAICTTPRSGSNLLCDLLHASGVMGDPREVLNVRSMLKPFASNHGLVEDDDRVDLRRYLDEVMRPSLAKGGVFGMKLLFDHLIYGIEFQSVRELLRGSRFVWLTRTDVISQAISSYLAKNLQAWSLARERELGEAARKRAAVPFDRDEIGGLIRYFGEQNAGWLEFFSVNRIDFLHVTYEELIADPGAVCRNICAFCGVATDFDFSLERSRYERQRDTVNETFKQRFAESSGLDLGRLDSPADTGQSRRRGLSLYESTPPQRERSRSRRRVS